MSYAIVKVGGKQYRVEEGQSILVDRMHADEGDKVDLQPLLFADGDKSVLDSGELGRVKIQAVVTGHELGKKIHGLKFKPKRGYKRPLRRTRAPHPARDQLDQGRRAQGCRQEGGL